MTFLTGARTYRWNLHSALARIAKATTDPETIVLTILFATYNGMQTLPKMIDRLRQIDLPPALHIVAVDNRSNDGTLEYLRSACAYLPMTVFECREPGKNRALNYGIDRIVDTIAGPDLIVITDDDILPQADWLTRLSEAAAHHDRIDVFGGTIRAAWPEHVPGWIHHLKEEYPVLFATTSATEGRCTSHSIFGPNMAVRARVFKQGTRFNPLIGPDGTGHFGMGSESDLLRRLEQAGHIMHFCEHAVVGHQVKPSLLNWKPVLSRAYRYGVGLDKLDAIKKTGVARGFATLRKVALSEVKAVASLLPRFRHRRSCVLFWRSVNRGRLHSLSAPWVAAVRDLANYPVRIPIAWQPRQVERRNAPRAV